MREALGRRGAKGDCSGKIGGVWFEILKNENYNTEIQVKTPSSQQGVKRNFLSVIGRAVDS